MSELLVTVEQSVINCLLNKIKNLFDYQKNTNFVFLTQCQKSDSFWLSMKISTKKIDFKTRIKNKRIKTFSKGNHLVFI